MPGRGPGADTADAEDITAGAGNNNEDKPGAGAGAWARWRGEQFQRWRLATSTSSTSGGEEESLEQRKLRSVLQLMGMQQKKVQRDFTWDTKTQEPDTRPRR